jgi:hypothetical protein
VQVFGVVWRVKRGAIKKETDETTWVQKQIRIQNPQKERKHCIGVKVFEKAW